MTVVNGDTPSDPVSLTPERASSIGWYFIQSYYEHYNSSIETLYKFYTSSGYISHGELGNNKVLHQAHGTESIKKLFDKLNTENAKSKIIVLDANIQLTLNDAILIVVSGEWSKNGSKYYQFNQTFVLAPGVKESTFDIANDVLKFIDYDYKHDILKQETETIELEAKKEETDNTNASEIKQATGTKTPAEDVKAASDAETEPVPEVRPKAVESTDDSQETEPKEPESTEVTTPPQNGNISWAAVATTAKDKTSKSPIISKPVPKKTTPTPTSNVLPNIRYKKEDWFPIYVRGCEGIAEKVLKDHLSKQFGEIKFFKLSGNIALCDFLEYEGQRKALDTKKTIVEGNTISLEIREAKADKRDNRKEKAYKKKTDKKPVPKKK